MTKYAKVIDTSDRIAYAAIVPVREYYIAKQFTDAETRECWSLHHLDGVPVKLMIGYDEFFGAKSFEVVEPMKIGDIDLNGEKCSDYHDMTIVGFEPMKNPGWLHCGGVVEYTIWYPMTRNLYPNEIASVREAYISRDKDGLLKVAFPG